MKFEYLREQDSIVIKKHHLDHDEELSNKEVLTHILNSRPAHVSLICIFFILQYLLKENFSFLE